ncbi:MAG: COQ9 family protein [Alphaproteobacteria bacterium]|jgi:ubiquinone biosynthesis protein COQ9|nr:COQ9 family protein [Alphaproteobacteria bacterium]MDP6516149.1 COQ9 family protein [Alphaproteobacteria bacterium]
MPPELEPERRRILAAALARVPFDGWSRACLDAATADAGLDRTLARRAFPRGIGDLLGFFMAEADRTMICELARRDLARMRIRERIATAVRVRLEQLTPHREAVRHALALAASPQYAPMAVAALSRTVDAMWRAGGDEATDFNYYTKRCLLAGVYGTTLLYWLSDSTPGFEATWQFLDRRIENVIGIQKARARLDGGLAKLEPGLISFARRFSAARPNG